MTPVQSTEDPKALAARSSGEVGWGPRTEDRLCHQWEPGKASKQWTDEFPADLEEMNLAEELEQLGLR